MKLPGGTGWQRLRADCLGAIPAGSSAPYTRPIPLREWRRTGYFQVVSCTSKQITLEAPAVDIGGALLSDAEHLLDNAAEHHSTLLTWVTGEGWHSPGWSVVTTYYWSFFLGMALTRLVGKTTWFLSRQALSDFRILANANTQPAAGTLGLLVGQRLSATDREVSLHCIKKPLHDAMWGRVAEIFGELLSSADANASPLEYRALRCFDEAKRRLTAAWPSAIRNAVNYVPGLGYREVLRRTDIDVVRYLRNSYPLDAAKVVSEFENHVFRVGPKAQPGDDVPSACRLMLLFALLLAGITCNLHAELLDRNSLDRRWLLLRNNFLRQRGVLTSGIAWPFAD